MVECRWKLAEVGKSKRAEVDVAIAMSRDEA